MQNQFGRRIGSNLMNLLYPHRCFVCGEAAPWGRELCPECQKKLPYIAAKRCRICSKPIEESEILCDDCKKQAHHYDQGFGLLLYDEVMREAMIGLKYQKRAEYGRSMGLLLYDGARDKLARWKADAIVPIPIHKKRRQMRGYNQAEKIAEVVAERSGIPMRCDLLIRAHETVAMKALTPTERKENLIHAFSCPVHLRDGVTILLIDDIYTTGATVDAAAAVLKAAGAGFVYFLSVCIGKGFMIK